jgi:hypothetical protein
MNPESAFRLRGNPVMGGIAKDVKRRIENALGGL